MKRNGRVAKIGFGVGARGVVSHAGGRLLVETAARIGLAAGLRAGLARWRPTAVHDPGTVLLHAALSLAVGGRRPVDMAVLRAAPGVFGPVASPATVSRTVAALVADDGGAAAEAAIWQALADARAVAWQLGGAPARDAVITVDLDASLVTVYSAKQGAANTFKKTFGLHPLFGFIDHGPGGTGEPAGALLRPGNAGSNTAADHITVLERVLASLPEQWTRRDGHGRRPILVRIDGAGATHALLDFIHEQGMQFSVRYTLTGPDIIDLATALPGHAWTPALAGPATIDSAGVAQVAEATDDGWVRGWPPDCRLIVRREYPSSVAKYRQLSICEVDGMRYTAILTNRADLPADVLELDHRRHARVEDRIKDGKDTGLTDLPYPDLASNRIWLAIIACAQLLLAHTARLALTGPWRVASPKTLRHRLFACAGRLVHTSRRTRLDYPTTWPWTTVIIDALTRLTALPDPG